ncbi:uncharacterized protein F4807DRAFT_459051 [Annulohypoxylon truncatum]|uniref:uncharacterized protein n=1 Tax=Annulohypoxylon truncatum TaxID=327061 RepID=UPI002007C2D2|nr:uncharacterized protein F4807DRAFT_459051 [Annulohypoxylon truncatum]KAI1210825.1 hypothetical protein F4807DRAFT_459051 [Annulohypoxylon truncatum]
MPRGAGARARRNRRRQLARQQAAEAQRAEAQRAANANISQREPEAEPSRAQAQQAAPPDQSDWDAYATDPDLQSFEKCAQENLRVLFTNLLTLTEEPQPPQIGGIYARHVTVGMNEMASIPFGPDGGEVFIRPFGYPGPLHPHFVRLIEELRSTIGVADPGQRKLKQALKGCPEVEFLGMCENTLAQTAHSIYEATLEVVLKWFRKNLPGMKLPHECEIEEACALLISDGALEMGITDESLFGLYANFLEAYAMHSIKPKTRDITLIADACVVLCRVLNDEKMAYLIDKIKNVAQWLHFSLGCKFLKVQGEAAHKIAIGTRDPIGVIERAFAEYNMHRAYHSMRMTQQTKAFVEYTQQAELADPYELLYPGESDDSDNPEY